MQSKRSKLTWILSALALAVWAGVSTGWYFYTGQMTHPLVCLYNGALVTLLLVTAGLLLAGVASLVRSSAPGQAAAEFVPEAPTARAPRATAPAQAA